MAEQNFEISSRISRLPDVLLTALKSIATLETSLEANYDRRTPHGRTKRLIGARATALPKKKVKAMLGHYQNVKQVSPFKELNG